MAFDISLFECRSVLSPVQRGTGSEGLHFQLKIKKLTFVEIIWKVIDELRKEVLNGFIFFLFCLTLSVPENWKTQF